MVQAHPFRNGSVVLNPEFLDGVEINSHPLYGKSFAEELLEIAEKNNLLVTSGGDYHADTYKPKCGMEIPKEIKTEKELGAFLLNGEKKEIIFQEPNAESITKIKI